MQEGRILAGRHHGAYVLRLEGDVRLNLCTTIDEYLQKMYADPEFASVWVDLCHAEGIDSTTLGMLAKLALEVQQRFQFRPVVYTSDAGITRLLKSMGFARLFDIRQGQCDASGPTEAIPVVDGSESEVKEKVVEAHRVLMDLSEENRRRFKDLMSALERS